MDRSSSLRLILTLAVCSAALLSGCASREERIDRGLSEANQLLQEGAADKALAVLGDLNGRYPGRPRVLESLAFAYAEKGDHAQAGFFFSEAAESDPDGRIGFLFAGEALQQAGDYGGASSRFTAYLDYFPDDPRGWKSLGEAEEARGQAGAAVDAYLRWQRLEPNPEAAYRLANLFVQLNNFAQAAEWFRTAAAQHGPNENVALLGLLQIQLQANDLVAAREILLELDAKFPGYLDASPFHQARQQIQQWVAAQEEVRRALAEQERLTRELAAAREAAAAQPPPPPPAAVAVTPRPAAPPPPPSPPPPPPATALASEARALRNAGRLEEAIALYWKSLAADDARAEVWADLADVFQLAGRYGEAEACLLEALRREPSSEPLQLQHLALVRDTQSLPVYIRELEAARTRFPASLDLLLLLGQAYSNEQYDVGRAIARYREFLMVAPLQDGRRAEVEAWLRRHGGA